jgi:hypothetical protein
MNPKGWESNIQPVKGALRADKSRGRSTKILIGIIDFNPDYPKVVVSAANLDIAANG